MQLFHIFGKPMLRLLLLSFCLLTTSIHARQAAVATPDSFSADIAMQIMQNGGNAIDAAIAVNFSLAVTLPEAGNLGGGGFIVFRDHNGQASFIDYRETAPAQAHRDMYLDAQGNVIKHASMFTSLAAGVPGTVAGMQLAHEQFGSLPWEQLLEPAIRLAEDGFIVPQKLADKIVYWQSFYAKHGIKNNFADYFAHAKAGQRFRQPELAATLKRIQQAKSDGFYRGQTASYIDDFMRREHGLVSHQDLQAYRAKLRPALQRSWQTYQLITAPPPSSGGIAITQWLNMFSRLDGQRLPHNSVAYIHLLAEIGKRVFADRAEYLGDADFVDVPVKALTSPYYLAKRASQVNVSNISATADIQPGLAESEDTTHFSIIDFAGNAVANTTTLNYPFGNGMVVPGAGFLLNNEMDDFSVKPGVPNAYGAIGGTANAIASHKRMLSSMTPTIVVHNNQVKMVTGSPGGTTIISSVYQSILNALVYDMSAQMVVDTPRFHHQLLPQDQIRLHQGVAADTQQQLRELGYQLNVSNFGDMQVIIRRDGQLDAAAESRGRGRALVISQE